jgi:hypothetical protein
MNQAKSCPLSKWFVFPNSELSLPLIPKALVNEQVLFVSFIKVNYAKLLIFRQVKE